MQAFSAWWRGDLASPRPAAVTSPWSEGNLSQVVAADAFGVNAMPVSREEALRVGAIYKARAILHALIVGRPLKVYRGDTELPDQPSWLYRSDSGIPAQYRTASILDDLIFESSCLLEVTARGTDNAILDVRHVPFSSWVILPDGNVEIDNERANPDDVIWIPSPGPGLLNIGAEKVRESRDLDRASAARARNPIAAWDLHTTDDTPLTKKERKALVESVAAARRDPDGAIISTPSNVSLNVYGDKATDFFVGGRNAIRLDIASFFALPASMLDGGVSSTSLDYSTEQGKRSEVYDYAIRYWIGPIEAWLSQDRVTPRGTRIAFDFSDLLNPSQVSGPALED